MKNSNLCPICNLKVNDNDKYFAFPKLPLSSSQSSICRITHLDCLRFNPYKIEIQNELTRVYMQIFENHSERPILARSDRILVRNNSSHQMLEILNFEDFVEFYISYWQIDDFLELKSGQEIALGINGWIILFADHNGNLTIKHRVSKQKLSDIDMTHLNLSRLKNIISIAFTKVNV